jgi:hypothetical protein
LTLRPVLVDDEGRFKGLLDAHITTWVSVAKIGHTLW